MNKQKAFIELPMSCTTCGAPLYVGADNVLRNETANDECKCSGEFERPTLELIEIKPKKTEPSNINPVEKKAGEKIATNDLNKK